MIQVKNKYDGEVFNGDAGYVVRVDAPARSMTVEFPETDYQKIQDGEPVSHFLKSSSGGRSPEGTRVMCQSGQHLHSSLGKALHHVLTWLLGTECSSDGPTCPSWVVKPGQGQDAMMEMVLSLSLLMP